MTKPFWRPRVDSISGWQLHHTSDARTAVIRFRVIGQPWEWVVADLSGTVIDDGRAETIEEAIEAASIAWEDCQQ